jgi:hypothetical protein
MIRRIAAVVLALHGVAHTVGFVATFQLGDYAGKAVDTTLLWGRLDIGLAATQAMGIGWLVLAAAFVASAALVWRGARHSIAILGLVTAVSLVFSVLASPTAIVGVGVNVVILVGLVVHEVVPARATTSRSGSNTGPSIPIG